MYLENFALDLLTMTVQGRETFYSLSASLKWCLVLDMQGVASFTWVLCAFEVRNMLIHVTCHMITFAGEKAGRWARGSLKYSTFRPFWNAPMNSSWFGWTNITVASLKRARYSLRDSNGPCWRLLSMLSGYELMHEFLH